MKQFLRFLLLLPFKNRIIGIALIFVILIIFFRYFELNPSGKKQDVNVGPVTLHLNEVEIKQRTAKPIVPTPTSSAPTTARANTPPPSPEAALPVSYTSTETVLPVLESHKQITMTPPTPIDRLQVRMGSVKLNKMDALKFSDPLVQETLVRTAREFDLLAVQGFDDFDLRVVKDWVSLLNSDGGAYAYLAAFPSYKNKRAPFVAFIYNRRAVDADKNTLLVLESGNRMQCAPIAALFTARSADNRPAFTFIAMNVWLDSTYAYQELPILLQTFPLLSNYIKGEDDILIMGDFGLNLNFCSETARNPELRWVAERPFTNYLDQPLSANIVFYKNSCTEYQNQYGLFSVEALCGLSKKQLAPFMPNPPLWGTFSVREAGR